MRKLRLLVVGTAALVALFVGSGIAFAGGEWCDWGSPPPVEAGMVAPHANAPTPHDTSTGWQVPNDKFVVITGDNGDQVALPPGIAGNPNRTR